MRSQFRREPRRRLPELPGTFHFARQDAFHRRGRTASIQLLGRYIENTLLYSNSSVFSNSYDLDDQLFCAKDPALHLDAQQLHHLVSKVKRSVEFSGLSPCNSGAREFTAARSRGEAGSPTPYKGRLERLCDCRSKSPMIFRPWPGFFKD